MATQRDGGWDVQEQSLPYHEPVAPVVPKADNTAAEIISRNTPTLVHAILESARQRQENDLATRRMAQEEALRIQGLDVEKRGQDMHYKLGLLSHEMEGDKLTAEMNHWDDLDELAKQRNDTYDKLTGAKLSAAQEILKSNQSKIDLSTAARKDAVDLGLEDWDHQRQFPAQFAANADHFRQLYEGSSDPTIKAQIAEYNKRANQSKVTLDGKEYSWAEVMKSVKLGGAESKFWPLLKKQNLIETPGKDAAGNDSGKPTSSGAIAYRVDPTLTKMMEDSQKADFGKFYESKVGPGGKTLRESPASGDVTDMGVQAPLTQGGGVYDSRTTKAGRLNPGADLPEPEQDLLHQQAATALARGGDPAKIRKILTDAGGDPSKVPGL